MDSDRCKLTDESSEEDQTAFVREILKLISRRTAHPTDGVYFLLQSVGNFVRQNTTCGLTTDDVVEMVTEIQEVIDAILERRLQGRDGDLVGGETKKVKRGDMEGIARVSGEVVELLMKKIDHATVGMSIAMSVYIDTACRYERVDLPASVCQQLGEEMQDVMFNAIRKAQAEMN